MKIIYIVHRDNYIGIMNNIETVVTVIKNNIHKNSTFLT